MLNKLKKAVTKVGKELLQAVVICTIFIGSAYGIAAALGLSSIIGVLIVYLVIMLTVIGVIEYMEQE